mgnify:CR=1 FL=1
MLNFKDRRQRFDRRQSTDTPPITGCRRRGERRNRLRQYEAKPWWLQVGYVEEIELPQMPANDT